MKRAIEILPSKPGYEPFQLEVQEPGIVRGVVTGFEEPSKILLGGDVGGAKPQELKPLAAVMFEVDPDREKKIRNFIWLPAGMKLNYPNKLEFRATYVDEVTGTPLLLFEASK
jgi:hypothetical protein